MDACLCVGESQYAFGCQLPTASTLEIKRKLDSLQSVYVKGCFSVVDEVLLNENAVYYYLQTTRGDSSRP